MGLPCCQVDDGEKMSELAGDIESPAEILDNIAPVESKKINDDKGGASSSHNNYSRPEGELATDDEQATCNSQSCSETSGDDNGKKTSQITTFEISQEFDNPLTSPVDVVVIVKCRGSVNPSFRQKMEEMKLKGFKKSKRKEVKVTTETQVPFYKLFMFADWWDHILIAVGTIGACAHGVAVPVFFLFFGDLIDSFGANYNNPDKMGQEVSKVHADPYT